MQKQRTLEKNKDQKHLPETQNEKKTWVEPKMESLVIEAGPTTPGFDGAGRNT